MVVVCDIPILPIMVADLVRQGAPLRHAGETESERRSHGVNVLVAQLHGVGTGSLSGTIRHRLQIRSFHATGQSLGSHDILDPGSGNELHNTRTLSMPLANYAKSSPERPSNVSGT